MTIESEVGTKITFEEVQATLNVESELTALGPFELDLVGCKFGANSCETAGDPEGTVLINGEYHLVFTALIPLEAAVLFLFNDLTIIVLKNKVEFLKLKIKAPLLAGLVAKNMEMLTKFGLTIRCVGKGKQELTKYENDEEKFVEKQLMLGNLGIGFENVCANIEEELKFTSDPDLEFLI